MLADDMNVLKKWMSKEDNLYNRPWGYKHHLIAATIKYNQNFYLTSAGSCLSSAIPENRNNRL